MQSNLWVPLLLQIADNGLSNQLLRFHDIEDVFVPLVHQGNLEEVLRGVDGEFASVALTVHVAEKVVLDSSEIDWVIERANDAIIAVGKQILDVGGGGVNEHATFVPGAALDTGILGDGAAFLQFAGAQMDICL